MTTEKSTDPLIDIKPEKAVELKKDDSINMRDGTPAIVVGVAKETIVIPSRKQEVVVLSVRPTSGAYAGTVIDVQLAGFDKLPRYTPKKGMARAKVKAKSRMNKLWNLFK